MYIMSFLPLHHISIQFTRTLFYFFFPVTSSFMPQKDLYDVIRYSKLPRLISETPHVGLEVILGTKSVKLHSKPRIISGTPDDGV